MDIRTIEVRSGYDGKTCLVHARCCQSPFGLIATAQNLNVDGCDLFEGIQMSRSLDEGRTWSEFSIQEGLAPVEDADGIHVGCDATPMYHHGTGKVLLLGHTAHYTSGSMQPDGRFRRTFYSVYEEQTNRFTQMRFLDMPKPYEAGCGNGSGQSVELENGDLLIPVYFQKEQGKYASMAIRCSFDGTQIRLLECGNELFMPICRGLYEPSLICHQGKYYMTLRNDECGCVAVSEDGLHYTELQLWKWEDGSILPNYNTQQHWMVLGEDLYLVYTRRGAENDHVFRHRAPLFAARVEQLRLVRESERVVVPQRGARLGNFTATQLENGKAAVMAAEWMQPKGCEAYGSDNTIFYSELRP